MSQIRVLSLNQHSHLRKRKESASFWQFQPRMRLFKNAQFLQIPWEQRNGSTHEAVWIDVRERFSASSCLIRPLWIHVSEAGLNAPGQERSAGAQCVLESFASGTCLGRQWSFISSPHGRKNCLLTLTPLAVILSCPFLATAI